MSDAENIAGIIQAATAWKNAQGREPTLSWAEWQLWNAIDQYQRGRSA